MTIPNDRTSFKDFCLRRLGYPVVQHFLDEDQIDDCVDIAMKMYQDYHFDGVEHIYYTYSLSQTDINNKYITLPDNIIGAIKIYNPTGIFQGSGMFNIQYQFMIANLNDIANMTVAPYYSTMQNLQLLDQILNGQKPFRYNRHTNQFHIDTDWNQYYPGMYLMIEAYQVVDPDLWPKTWGDRWLQEYCVALLKKEQGTVLKLYNNMMLPGGLQINGQQIYDDAVADLEKLSDELLTNWSLPVMSYIG